MINIQIVKFTSGEEVLTEIKAPVPGEFSDTKVKVLRRPIRVVILPPEKGVPDSKPKIAFSAFIPYADAEEFEIDSKDILLITKPVEELVEQYKEIFGLRSSIILPTFGANDPLAASKTFDPLAAIKAANQKN